MAMSAYMPPSTSAGEDNIDQEGHACFSLSPTRERVGVASDRHPFYSTAAARVR